MRRFFLLLTAVLLCITATVNPSAKAAVKIPSEIRIGILLNVSAVDFQIPKGGKLISASGKILWDAVSAAKTLRLTAKNGTISTPNGNLSECFTVTSGANNSGIIWVNGKQYRGKILLRSAGKVMNIINVLDLEHYLQGVLPKEVHPDWPLESLKAQAVAARSYTLANLNKHSGSKFDLCARTHCQVYGGKSGEHSRTNRAVKDTSGMVATYAGRAIAALYHASSGGHTECSSNVWDWDVPYLKGVADLDPSPHCYWYKVMTAAEMEEAFRRNGYQLGRITQIIPDKKGTSGRIASCTFVGEHGQVELTGEKARTILGLKSTLFTIEWQQTQPSDGPLAIPAVMEELAFSLPTAALTAISIPSAAEAAASDAAAADAAAAGESQLSPARPPIGIWAPGYQPSQWVIRGRGWGHGVGMSQWGAMALAERGHTFDEILKYYYYGITIESRN